MMKVRQRVPDSMPPKTSCDAPLISEGPLIHWSPRWDACKLVCFATYARIGFQPDDAHLPGGALDDVDAADDLALQLGALVRLAERLLQQLGTAPHQHRLQGSDGPRAEDPG